MSYCNTFFVNLGKTNDRHLSSQYLVIKFSVFYVNKEMNIASGCPLEVHGGKKVVYIVMLVADCMKYPFCVSRTNYFQIVQVKDVIIQVFMMV